MLDTLMGRVGVVANGGTHTVKLVGRDGRTHAASAYQDAAVHLAALYSRSNCLGKVRIIIFGIILVGPEIDHLMI
jgi:hypothetical protein